MRLLSLLAVSAALAATPVLAQSPSGNAGQPSRDVPQAGQATGGPRATPAAPMNPGPDATGTVGGAPGGGVESAKRGNDAAPNRAAPNLGTTSGGPSR
ncbi:hypothetical protein OPKNFCMD_5030 [Methylobacterium crusticola]|uniref:Translation initiation factor IF-2 n=1 Tax=Methylobacterium crusticola TaxID=1697972 RepID=A0ABQ4R681_9HYPH|nr:hypothetical protein [Methylobacterium crusticola]GJD52267.1 hypothetical protein OPKNFCMD_5030 [Methylobacterium crusticola]